MQGLGLGFKAVRIGLGFRGLRGVSAWEPGLSGLEFRVLRSIK